MGTFKPVVIPASGLMNNRSLPDALPGNQFRLQKNIVVSASGTLCRMPGWSSYASHDESGNSVVGDNSDLHDQMVERVIEATEYEFYPPETGYTYDYCADPYNYRPYCDDNFPVNKGREAITLLHEFTTGSGVRHLIAGTQSRLYVLYDRSNNWRIIADGLGGTPNCFCGDRRFYLAQMGNVIVLTNNYDPIMYWRFDEPEQGCELQSAIPIPDLQDLEIERASAVVEYKGFIFLMNLDTSSGRFVSRMIWSDLGDPISFAQSSGSLAGDAEVGDPSEAIIDAKVLGDYLWIFKERSIWRCTLVDPDDGLFNFQQVYKGEKTPRYRNTLVSNGEAIFFFSHDDIYYIDLFSQDPKSPEWMSDSTGIIFDKNLVFSSENLAGGINEDQCLQAVGGYDPVRQHLWFSWVSYVNSDGSSNAETTAVTFTPRHRVDCPNRTMVFGMRDKFTSYVDHGFTAFCSYRPDERMSLRDFLTEYAGLASDCLDQQFKEGEPYYYPAITTAEGITCIWNADEDPDEPMDEDSLCANLGDQVLEDFCEDCPGGTEFLMASAADYCIKRYNEDAYHREHYTIATNTYSQLGYTTAVETGALNLGTDSEKYLSRLMAEVRAPVQAGTQYLYCRLGQSSQPECEIWKDPSPQALECQTDATDGGTIRSYDKLYYNYYMRGRYLFVRLYVTGTTGETCLSRMEFHVRRAER